MSPSASSTSASRLLKKGLVVGLLSTLLRARQSVQEAVRVEGDRVTEELRPNWTLTARQRPAFTRHQAASASRLRIRTRLYTAVAKVNIHPTRSTPRCLVLRISPTVFNQPKISSTRLRTLWLML